LIKQTNPGAATFTLASAKTGGGTPQVRRPRGPSKPKAAAGTIAPGKITKRINTKKKAGNLVASDDSELYVKPEFKSEDDLDTSDDAAPKYWGDQIAAMKALGTSVEDDENPFGSCPTPESDRMLSDGGYEAPMDDGDDNLSLGDDF
jgi:hypothetical protein